MDKHYSLPGENHLRHADSVTEGRIDGRTIHGGDGYSQPTITERMDRLTEDLASLMSALDVLRERIQPVMTPEIVLADTDGGVMPATEERSSLSNHVKHLSQSVRDMTHKVGNITSHIDL